MFEAHFQSFEDRSERAVSAPRVAALRAELAKRGLDGFIVPRADRFQNEYVPPCAEQLAWLTGFTGSAGIAIVLADRAVIFVDGRYQVQVQEEIDGTIFSVAHVIENPPRSGRRADLVQRYWDIAGRRYEGVYPIDFHIILTGEEVHSGGIRPESGTTKVRIVVKGAYTDDEMDARIGDEWTRLRGLTQETLGRHDSAASQPG